MNKEFQEIIEKDLEIGRKILEEFDINRATSFHVKLVSKYDGIIDGFKENLNSLWYDDYGKFCKENIQIMIEKLESFKSEASVKIQNHNTNTNIIDIQISFEQARKKIEEMTSLTEEQIEETMLKVNELEKIVNSPERKTKKWEQAKDIIKWVADKGVDVGIALLPLILQIQ